MLPDNDLQRRLARATGVTVDNLTQPPTTTANGITTPKLTIYDDILKSITLTGVADIDNVGDDNKIKHLILESRNNIQSIIQQNSGKARMRKEAAKKFNLILDVPAILKVLDRQKIRCVFCKQIVSMPCWYYNMKYSVSWFHYFVCFDASSPETVTTKCYRKDKI